MQDSERGLEHKLNVFLLSQCYYWLAIPTTNIKGSWRQFMRPLEDRKGSQAITVAPTCEADFVCVDGEDGELRRCEGEGPLKCGRAEQNTQASLEVERFARLVVATVLQTFGQMKHARNHGDRVCGRGVHMAGDELEG